VAVHPSRPMHAPHLKDVAAVHTLACDDLIASTPAMLGVLRFAHAYAPADTSVLLWGESGSGKTSIAALIHHLSGRAGGFHDISVGNLSAQLAEDELFGHVRGAFTDARADRPGALVVSGVGTVLLDDLQGMDISVQRKLLRVLDRGTFSPLGTDRIVTIACRFIFAMNAHPDELVRQGILLPDLRYRCRRCEIAIPPLRERRAEIALLIQRVLARLPEITGIAGSPRLTANAVELLREGEYPGNVRDLESFIVSAFLLAHGEGRDEILPEDFCPELSPPLVYPRRGSLSDRVRVVRRALERMAGNVAAAARLLGVSRNVVRTALAEQRSLDRRVGETRDRVVDA
jgi:DNA-binding NtrC family response regulator